MKSSRIYSLFTLMAVSILLSGCSGKKYFKPTKTHAAPTISYGEKIIDLSGNGATLKSGRYVGNLGLSRINLGEGYRFLNQNTRYVLASNAEGILNIIDKNTKKSARAVSLHVPVVSATIKDGIVAYILNNNTFGLYQIKDNNKIIENRSERTYAIDTKAASPLFIDNLAVMPMLDGKIIIVDIFNSDNTKVVYISSKKAFNNVIHLSRMGNTLVAATPNKIITLGGNGKQEFVANISELVVSSGYIYVFTKEGGIVKLDDSLNVVAKTKFKFAHYAVATVFNSKVFVLDQQGSLIVLSSDLKKSKIYALGLLSNPAFIAGSRLYKDGKIIELYKLGYE